MPSSGMDLSFPYLCLEMPPLRKVKKKVGNRLEASHESKGTCSYVPRLFERMA